MQRTLKAALPGGVFADVPLARSELMARIYSRGTKSTERRFRMRLVRAGMRDWVMHPKLLGTSPDIYFPQQRLAIFLDGCFWHCCPTCGHLPKTRRRFWQEKFVANKRRDRRDVRRLKKRGIRVIRIWEHQLRDESWHSRVMSRILALPPAKTRGREVDDTHNETLRGQGSPQAKKKAENRRCLMRRRQG